MGRGVRQGGHSSRQRLATFLFVIVFVFASIVNSLGTTRAQAISLPIGAIVDAIIPGDQSRQTPARDNQPTTANTTVAATAIPGGVDTTPPSVPGEPYTPADLAYIPGPAHYSWGASSDEQAGNITYEFQISQTKSVDENNQASLVNPHVSGNLSDTTYTPTTQAEGVWYWQVRARDATGNYSYWTTIREHVVDTTAPATSHNLTTDQQLSGQVVITETVTELHPLEYAIKVINPDGSDVEVDEQTVGITQNPVSSDRLDFNWDTTQVANGSYRVMFSARDKAGNNSVPLDVAVTVQNEPDPPPVDLPYSPLTPDLTPVALNPSVVMTVAEAALSDTPPPPEQPSQSSPKTDVLAERVEAAATQKQQNIEPSVACARFFGICWYWSAPGTLLLATGAYVMHRLRNRT